MGRDVWRHRKPGLCEGCPYRATNEIQKLVQCRALFGFSSFVGTLLQRRRPLREFSRQSFCPFLFEDGRFDAVAASISVAVTAPLNRLRSRGRIRSKQGGGGGGGDATVKMELEFDELEKHRTS